MDPSPHLWILHAKQPLLDPIRKSLYVPDITCSLCLQCSVISTRTTCLYGSQPLSVIFACKTATFGAEFQSFMGPRHDLSFCAFTTAWLAPEILGSMGPSPHLWFLHAKQPLLDQSTSLLVYQTSPVVLCMQNSLICTRMKRLYGFQLSPVVLCMQNSDFWTRITNLYWSQTSPVVLCRQYSVISTRNTCLYGSQPLSVIFACKTATFGAEFQSFMGHRRDLSFCACKTAWLASELLVSMSPSPHVWFLDAKQRLLDRNNKSLWVPDITCHCVHAKQRD